MTNNNINVQVPTWFWVVSGLALVWNLLGLMAFVMHLSITPEMLAAMSEAERGLYQNAPSWLVYAFATAVIAGTLGCVGLLMKKAWSMLVLLLSLVGVLAQNAHSFFMSNTFEVMGDEAMAMPLMVITISTLLVYFASVMKNKGIIL